MTLRGMIERATPGEWRLVMDGTGVQMGEAGGFIIHKDANPKANAALIVYLHKHASAMADLIDKVNDTLPALLRGTPEHRARYIELSAALHPMQAGSLFYSAG